MDERFLIDTNIIIYYLNNEIPANHLERVEEIIRTSFHISTITKIELLGWRALDKEGESEMRTFLAPAQIIYVDPAIEEQAIQIKQGQKIKTPDAIIGATAIVYDMTVVTRNVSDFDKIDGIRLYNPFE
ncbi:MAG: type II toxin-antitoxin system VapC family toxin [Bacteroidota bacterium]